MFHIIEACNTFKFIPYVTANPAMPVKSPIPDKFSLYDQSFLLKSFKVTYFACKKIGHSLSMAAND